MTVAKCWDPSPRGCFSLPRSKWIAQLFACFSCDLCQLGCLRVRMPIGTESNRNVFLNPCFSRFHNMGLYVLEAPPWEGGKNTSTFCTLKASISQRRLDRTSPLAANFLHEVMLSSTCRLKWCRLGVGWGECFVSSFH